MESYFMLFANCIITEGATRSIIGDLQRKRYKPIPALLTNILRLLSEDKQSINAVKQQFDNEYNQGIDLFLKDLEAEGYGIVTTDIAFFPKLTMNYAIPARVSNAIIDFDAHSNYNTDTIAQQLDELGCQAIEVRFFHTPTVEDVIHVLKPFNLTGIRSIELLLKCSDYWTSEKCTEAFIAQRRLHKVIVHSALIEEKLDHEYLSIFHIKKAITSSKCCGQIGLRYLNLDLKHFTESQQHNTCLNRKISIDQNGYIKNCPSMAQSFGHIQDTSLEQVLENPEFTKMWYLKKDEISKCKSCEFRHICTDCRAYLENPEDMYSAPLKCGYNPTTTIWEDWSSNPLKQQAMEYYDLEVLV